VATEVIVIVDPDSGAGFDYTSLGAAIAGEARNLVTADEICVIKCRCTGGTADSSSGDLGTGFTTDATRYIKIWTDPNESYRAEMKRGVTGNVYRRTGPIYASQNEYVRIDGIHMENSNSLSMGDFASGGGQIQISNCFIRNSTNGSDIVRTGGSIKIWNTIIEGNGTTIKGIRSAAGLTIYASNVTVAECDIGFYGNGGDIVAKNCLGYSNSTADFDGLATGCTNCASSDATADDFGGSGNRVSQTFTFVDGANGDYHLQAGDAGALAFGTDLTADANTPFSDDIDGDTRPASWAIGADDIPSAGGFSVARNRSNAGAGAAGGGGFALSNAGQGVV
jgi:hypothetical protein